MKHKMKALFPLLALTVLLASCARVEYDTGEVAYYPVLLCDLLRFLAFALLNAVLLVQLFLPKLRQFYEAGARSYPRQTAAFIARMLFLFGLSLLPMSFALGGEAFFPTAGDTYTPFERIFLAWLVPFVAMPLGSIVLGIGAILDICGERALRLEEAPPLREPSPILWKKRLLLAGAIAAMLTAQGLLVFAFERPALDRLCRVAMSDFSFNEANGVIGAEARALAHHYVRTRDARAASATHRLTMLHLAAATHEVELVEQLLRDGADPNARMLSRPEKGGKLAPGDTPLTLALRRPATHEPGFDIESAAVVVKILLRAGADAGLTGHAGSSPLTLCAQHFPDEQGFDYHTGEHKISGEELALHLLNGGARGGQKEAERLLHNGWALALGKMLELGMVERPAELLASCGKLICDKNRHARDMVNTRNCVIKLMGHVSAECKAELLATLCRHEQENAKDERSTYERKEAVTLIAQLLALRVDPLHPAGEHGRSCAADYIAADAYQCRQLEGMGVVLSEPPVHKLEANTLVMQLLDIPTMAFREEEAREHFGLLQTLLIWPTAAQLGAPESWHRACARALALMRRADDARVRELVPTLPLWAPEAWQQDKRAHARGLLYALQQSAVPLMPADKLLEHARAMLAAGHADVAHAFICLMERDPQAEQVIENLCSEGSPEALRAAAWTCKLHRHKLPAPGGELRPYFDQFGEAAPRDMTDALKLALRADNAFYWVDDNAALLQPERLIFSGETQSYYEHYERHRSAFRQLGAHKTLALYNSESQDEVAASFELEILLGQHLWQHRHQFYKQQGEVSPKD